MQQSSQQTKKLVKIGIIVAAHGIRGAVKIKSFTANAGDILNYGALYTRDQEHEYKPKILSESGSVVIAKFPDINTRNQAEKMIKTELYIEKDRLPEPEEGEYYYTDLIGMTVLTTNNEPYGRIITVHNFGAGDIVEIELDATAGKIMHSFKNSIFPTIDITNKTAIIALPTLCHPRA